MLQCTAQHLCGSYGSGTLLPSLLLLTLLEHCVGV